MKKLIPFLFGFSSLLSPSVTLAQINSGSDGSDGVFNPTVSTNINMGDRPSGVYQFKSINIPGGVEVTFTPNAKNSPVVWLVQGDCVIDSGAKVHVSAMVPFSGWGSLAGMPSGPGGFAGGNGGSNPTGGQGPGGGPVGGAASYATTAPTTPHGDAYGNIYIMPLIGGSGGGGSLKVAGGGGGGALLIAANGTIQMDGWILASGSITSWFDGNQSHSGASGSGGAVRLVATTVAGGGLISARGSEGNDGRIRFDTYDNRYAGTTEGAFTWGIQPVILPASGQGLQLDISSVGGTSVSPTPTGQLNLPDAIIAAQQSNPIPVVERCTNVPLNTPVTVTVKPLNGVSISAVGANTTGTAASSTATILINMPRGGGQIYATAQIAN